MQQLSYTIFLLLFVQTVSVNDQMMKGKKVLSINKQWEQEILKYTNEERTKRGLLALEWNEELSYAARYHAKDMAENNYFSHESYNRINKTVARANILFKYEAREFLNPQHTTVFEDFKNSTTK